VCSPNDNILTNHVAAKQFIEDNMDIPRNEIASRAGWYYQKWYDGVYVCHTDVAPSFEEWAEAQDEKLLDLWDILHS